MVELLIYPIITGIVASIFSVVFEYYIIIPNKEKGNEESNPSLFNPSLSLKFILTQFAGIIILELIIRTFFPKFNISTELLGGVLKDSNITFASIFYVCITSILLTFQSKSKFLCFIGTHLIPYLSLAWWTFTFPNVFKIFESSHSPETTLPFIHNILLCWLFYGLNVFLKNLDILAILAVILFPLNALFMLNYTTVTNVGAWGGALFTTVGMFGIISFINEYRNSLKEKELMRNQAKPTSSRQKL
ncbi:MAG: hypothetical protein V4585_01075 [Bacteroidota bacterium]